MQYRKCGPEKGRWVWRDETRMSRIIERIREQSVHHQQSLIHLCSACACRVPVYARSPRMRRASCMSFGMMVTRFACIAQRFVSSKSPTRYASLASCRAITAELWKRRSVLKSCAISRTRRWNGSFLISSSVDFWYLLISRSATVPSNTHHNTTLMYTYCT